MGARCSSTFGTWKTSSAYGTNRSSPSSQITTGVALCALNMAVSLTMSPMTVGRAPAAQTMIRGSEDRSMCFLSSTKSEEMVL